MNWLITGATSGFGRSVTERVLKNGDHVIAVGRRSDRLPAGPNVTPVTLDITADDAEDRLRTVIDTVGGLDVVVNCVGYGLFGSVEQTSPADARAIIETNLLANLAVLRAALPALRASRGRIVQISSMLAAFAWPSSGLYSASKAAVELVSEALALELAPSGVKVTIVEPGLYATGFSHSANIIAPDEVYAPSVGAFLSDFSALPKSAFGDPAEVADAIISVVAMAEPPLRLAPSADAITHIRASLQARIAELDSQPSLTEVSQ